jgi:hypothetical protein
MKLTEKKLLDNYIGLSNGGHIISKIDNKTIYWNYRNDGCVCYQKNASCILVEDYYTGILDKRVKVYTKWHNHKNAIKIRKDEAELFPIN